jgi:ABC-type lipoprotein release transport system permease subunit
MALPLAYHWRNLFVRKATTALTVLVLAVVVGVFAWLSGFSDSLRQSLQTASDPAKLIVMKRSATSESNSAMLPEEYNKLNTTPGLARDAGGQPLISPEMMVQVSFPRIRDGGRTWGNVALRGVTPTAFLVHANVKTTGRVFAPGSREVLVGSVAAKQFGGLDIGQSIQLGYGSDRAYTIVGHFTADGGPMESEIWGYLPSLMNSYNRTMYSSAYLRIAKGADVGAAIEAINGPAIELEAQTEGQYWSQQSANIRVYLGITGMLVAVMSIAAICAIANTMFAMVAGRGREIAMLRTIGYSGRQILTGFVVEALLLSLLGGVLGCLGCLAWLWAAGNTKDMFGASTFTTLAFEISLSPLTALWALGAVASVGVIGAFVPALRAARTQVIAALREP